MSSVTRQQGRSLLVASALAVALAGCGSAAEVAPLAQETPVITGLRERNYEVPRSNSYTVADADACSESMAPLLQPLDDASSSEGVSLSVGLAQAEYVLSLDSPPSFVAQRTDDPLFADLSVDKAAAFRSRADGATIASSGRSPFGTDDQLQPLFAAADVAVRLSSIGLDTGEQLLLFTGWSPVYEAWYVYRGFAVSLDGTLTNVDDCGHQLTARLHEVFENAKSIDPKVGTEAEFLLSTSQGDLESIEYPEPKTVSLDTAARDPARIGRADTPVEISIRPSAAAATGLVCFEQPSGGLCLASDAHGGKAYTYTLLLDSAELDSLEIFASPDGRRETATRQLDALEPLVRNDRRVVIEFDEVGDVGSG